MYGHMYNSCSPAKRIRKVGKKNVLSGVLITMSIYCER